MESVTYGFGADVDLAPEAAVERISATLKEHGFGILSRIDVHAVLKAKIGLDIPPYIILGACNPTFASRAIGVEPQVGLLLPCNVLVKANASGGSTVSLADPKAMGAITGNPEMKALMDEVAGRLRSALAAM